MEHSDALEQAMNWGKSQYPEAPMQHHAAFANSVAYLVTGWSGGYGGPSAREHAVSWALAGDGFNVQTDTNLGQLTVQYPDGRLPSAGEWELEKACQFAQPLCYGAIGELHKKVFKSEHCFDDAPKDIEELKKH